MSFQWQMRKPHLSIPGEGDSIGKQDNEPIEAAYNLGREAAQGQFQTKREFQSQKISVLDLRPIPITIPWTSRNKDTIVLEIFIYKPID